VPESVGIDVAALGEVKVIVPPVAKAVEDKVNVNNAVQIRHIVSLKFMMSYILD